MTGLWLSVFAPLFAAYLRTLSPTVPFEDGGEMIGPSYTLGINHPPGYPVYVLLGRLWALWPLGDLAFRYNLLSAVCMAAACANAALVTRRLAGWLRPGPGPAAPLAGLAAGLLLGAAPHTWWQAVIAEKYAMNLLFNSVLLWIIVGLIPEPGAGRRPGASPRRLLLLATAWGVSASHHGQTIYFAAAAALAGWWTLGRMSGRGRARLIALVVALIALGLSVKLVYLPVRSETEPLFNWNSPNRAGWLAEYLSGAPYQARIFYWAPAQVAGRLVAHLREYPAYQLGWPGVALALAGFAGLFARHRRAGFVLAAAAATGVAYCVNFSLEGIAIQTYYLPVQMLLAIGAGCGLALAAERLGSMHRRLPAALAAAALLWIGWRGAATAKAAARDRHYYAFDFAHALLKSVEPGAIFAAFGDYDLFPLWYVHRLRGERPDVILVNSNFITAPWAKSERKRVEFLYPPGQRDLATRMRYMEDLIRGDPGRPVYFSVIYEAIETQRLLPRGAAYRYVWRDEDIRNADVMAEWRRYKRWRTVRGVYDARQPRDSNTRQTLSYYPYADYRRGYVLISQNRHADAMTLFKAALRYPDFHGVGPAATHASMGLVLHRTYRDIPAAIREYRAAFAARPDWVPGLRALGALYVETGQYPEARDIFARVAALLPDDPQAALDLRRLEPFVPNPAPPIPR